MPRSPGHLPTKALVGEARRSRKVRDSRPTPLTPHTEEEDRVPSQIDEDAKAIIAAYMSHKRGSYEAFEALVDQAKAEPEEVHDVLGVPRDRDAEPTLEPGPATSRT